MRDRKRRDARPRLEPLEGRELLSGLLIALQPTNVPYLTNAQVASIASNRAQGISAGKLSKQAVGGSDLIAPGTGNASVGGPNTASAGGGLFGGGNNPQG